MNKKNLSPSKIKKITGVSYHEAVPFPFYYSPPFLDDLRGLIESRLASHRGRPTLRDKPIIRKIRFSKEGWEELEHIAKDWNKKGSSISPAQIASFLLDQVFLRSKSQKHV